MEQMRCRYYEMEPKLHLQLQNEDLEPKMQCQQNELEQMKQRARVKHFDSIQKRSKKELGDDDKQDFSFPQISFSL